jgi:hypothetical protein
VHRQPKIATLGVKAELTAHSLPLASKVSFKSCVPETEVPDQLVVVARKGVIDAAGAEPVVLIQGDDPLKLRRCGLVV